MKKKLFAKRILMAVLCLIIVLSVVPLPAFADGVYTFPSYSQSGDNNSTLRYYLTDENAGTITVKQNGVNPALTLTLENGWYFDKWDTYFTGYEDVRVFSDPEVKGANPVNDDGYYTFFNIDQKQPFSNKPFLYIRAGTGFYGDHRVTAVLKPIVTVNTAEGVSHKVTTNNPTSISDSQTAVAYGDNATITVDTPYVITNASASYGANCTYNGSAVTLSSVVKPCSVDITTRLKQHTVYFDANGGSGTMEPQVFEYGVQQKLTPNSFTRYGYEFVGWLTTPDDSGDYHYDERRISFKPEKDGETSTLYAIWRPCYDHNWKDGVCTVCGTGCSHTGGTATCADKAICEVCGLEYGNLLSHSYKYSAAENVITETCINGCDHSATATISAPDNLTYDGSEKTALVEFSEGWQGGKLTPGYSGSNINAGTVTAEITIGGVSAKVDYEIKKADPDLGTVGYSGIVKDTTKPSEVVLTRTNTEVPGTLKVVKAGALMRANRATYDWEFVPEDMDNYNVIYGFVDIDVLDTHAPSVSIKIDTNEWKELLNNITFGLFFKDTQEVTITYTEEENGSGLKDTLYYVADRELTADGLANAEWKIYTDKFSVEPDGEYVIYAKVSDKDGNNVTINSNGIVLDKTKPGFYGIENNGVYYGDKPFKVFDKNDYPVTLKVDGVDVTADMTGGDEYTIVADNKEHTLTLTDAAGNVTVYKITVYTPIPTTETTEASTTETTEVSSTEVTDAPTTETSDVSTTETTEASTTETTEVSSTNVTDAPTTETSDVPTTETTEASTTETTEVSSTEVTDAPTTETSDVPTTETTEASTTETTEVLSTDVTDIPTTDTDDVLTTNATDATSTDTVDSPKTNTTGAAKTGDNIHVAVWFAIFFICGGGLFFTLLCKKKQKTVEN